MASAKTTDKTPVLQVSALTKDEFDEVKDLAEAEDRTLSQTGAILIREALAARKASPNNSKEAAKR